MKELTNFTGGIHTDNKLIFQPKGSLRYALNSTMSSKEGDLGSRTNELGNINCLDLEEGFKIVGHKVIEDKVVLLVTNDTISIIGEKDKYCNFTELVRSSCLGFKQCNQIQIEHEIINGCERVIYLADGLNTDKAINLDALESYNDNPLTANEGVTNEWDCSLFNISPDVDAPCINVQTIYSGGSLDLGVYQVAVKYGNDNINQYTYDIVSNVVPVVNIVSTYEQTEGGLPSVVGKIPASLDITLTNVDLNYSNVTIAVIATIEGVTTAYNVITLETEVTVNYSFRGITASMTEVPLSEIAIDKVVYDTSKTLKIHDNRLLRANLQEKKINWHLFQQAANDITINYQTSANKHGDLNGFNGYKNSNLTFVKKSYLRDEIYAFGIVWIFNDLTKSPVMHIPGREKNRYAEGGVITFTQDPNGAVGLPTTEFAAQHTRMPLTGFSGNDDPNGWDQTSTTNTAIPAIDKTFNPSATERHQIYNTAIRTGVTVNTNTPNLHSGEMGYNESEDFSYPDVLDCDGVRVYPEGNIRHHRTPDTTLEPHFENINGDDFIIQMGINVGSIVVPPAYAGQVQGYYIVRAERQDVNKTIIDKGIIYNNMELEFHDDIYLTQCAGANKHFNNTLGTIGGYTNAQLTTSDIPARNAFAQDTDTVAGFQASNNSVAFHGPVTKFTDNVVADYIKIEGNLKGDVTSYGYVREQDATAANLNRTRSHEHIIYDTLFNESNTVLSTEIHTNRKINDQGKIEKHLYNGSVLSLPFVNNSQQEAFVIDADNKLPFVNVAESTAVTVLEIDDADSSYNPADATDTSAFNQTSTALYGSLKRLNTNPYNQLSNINYIPVSQCMETGVSILQFGGDTFINKFSFKKSYTTTNRNVDGHDTLFVQTLTMFVESEINTELRNELEIPTTLATGATAVTTYYPKQDIATFTRDSDYNQFTDGTFDTDTLGEVIFNFQEGNFAGNFYRYNSDYSKENTVKNYFGLNDSFKFCSDCLNFFPHRIVYSNKTFADSGSLEKRIFLTNSVTEIPNKFGEITNMFTDNDQLWIHSERSLFKQQTKPNEMQAGTSTIFLGVGEIFSIPPQQMRTIETGYAGSKHKFATHTNEMGTYFVSAEEGKIFLIQGSNLKEVSLNGNRLWFNENLPMVFEEQYERLTGSKYNCVEGISSSNSVGFMSVYDNEYKRWILHKKDYKIIDESTFDKDSIDFTDETKFENKSWTVSFIADNLVGWHSYLPDYMFNTNKELFLSKDNAIWTHNEGNFQTFFGVEYPHILEWVNNEDPINSRVFNSLEFRQSCEKYDLTYEDWIKDLDNTFTNIVAYNDNQSTGLLSVLNKDSNYNVIDYNPSQALAFHEENLWRINQLRDYSINPVVPNFTKNWASIQPTYPINKVVNTTNIDFNKSQYELARLRGKYLVIRATFNNPDKTLKLNTELFNTDYSNSVR